MLTALTPVLAAAAPALGRLAGHAAWQQMGGAAATNAAATAMGPTASAAQRSGLHTSSGVSAAGLGGYMGTGVPMPDMVAPSTLPTFLVTGGLRGRRECVHSRMASSSAQCWLCVAAEGYGSARSGSGYWRRLERPPCAELRARASRRFRQTWAAQDADA